MKFLIALLAFLSIIFSWGVLTPSVHYFFEVGKHLAPFLVLVHVTALFWFLLPLSAETPFRKTIITLLLAVITMYALPVVPYYRNKMGEKAINCTEEAPCIDFSFLQVVLAQGTSGNAIKFRVGKESPDIVAIFHPTTTNLRSLRLEESYPFRFERGRDDGWGLALYSKFKFVTTPMTSLGDDIPQIIKSEVQIAEGRNFEITLYNGAPITKNEYYTNKLISRRILTLLKHHQHEGIVSSDSHATLYSGFFKPFIWAAGYSDVRAGFTPFEPGRVLELSTAHTLARGALKVESLTQSRTPIDDDLMTLVKFQTPKKPEKPWEALPAELD